VTTIKDEPQD